MLRGSGVWVLGFENRRLARLESSPKTSFENRSHRSHR